MQLPEHLVHRQHQVAADGRDQLLVPAFLQFIIEDLQRVLDQLFVHRRQHAAPVDAAAGTAARAGQVLHADGLAAALGAAAQQVVAADAVIIRHLDHKGQAALPDAFFVMGKLRLADAQLLRGLFLRDAPFFTQQRKNAAELVGHIHPLPRRVPPARRAGPPGPASLLFLRVVYYIRQKTLCKPGFRLRFAPRFAHGTRPAHILGRAPQNGL